MFPTRAYPNRWAALLVALGAVGIACGAPPATAPIDLMAGLPAAERRAAGPIDEAIRVDRVIDGDVARPALRLEAPARVTWQYRLPDRARLVMAAARLEGEGVTLRVGISDRRAYDGLIALALDRASAGAWHPVDIDLRTYSGWKWSLFYQPSQTTWRIVINADATPGGVLALAEPAIVSRSRRPSRDNAGTTPD